MRHPLATAALLLAALLLAAILAWEVVGWTDPPSPARTRTCSTLPVPVRDFPGQDRTWTRVPGTSTWCTPS